MAYDRKKIFEQAKEQAKKNNLFFIEDVVAFIPCDKTTFYRFFPPDCNEYNDIKEILDDNKVKTKSSIRAKLFRSEKAAELLALYRLIATPDEHRRLNQQYMEHSGEMKTNPPLTPEEQAILIEKITPQDFAEDEDE